MIHFLDKYILKLNIFHLTLLFIIFLIIFLIVSISSFILFKIFKFVSNEIFFFNDFDKISHKTLQKYGDYEITKIYLVQTPINKILIKLLHILTFCRNQNQLNGIYFPYHSHLVFEINTEKNKTKFMCIEKINTINVAENFNVCDSQTWTPLFIGQKKLTLNLLLDETQKRIGKKKFFNWNIYKNNCQTFTKELIRTIGNKKNKFRCQNSKKIFKTGEFSFYMIHCCIILSNILSKLSTHFFLSFTNQNTDYP